MQYIDDCHSETNCIARCDAQTVQCHSDKDEKGRLGLTFWKMYFYGKRTDSCTAYLTGMLLVLSIVWLQKLGWNEK